MGVPLGGGVTHNLFIFMYFHPVFQNFSEVERVDRRIWGQSGACRLQGLTDGKNSISLILKTIKLYQKPAFDIPESISSRSCDNRYLTFIVDWLMELLMLFVLLFKLHFYQFVEILD